MSGSEDKNSSNDIRWMDLIDVACGEADDATKSKVREALRDPNHPVSYLKSRRVNDQAGQTTQKPRKLEKLLLDEDAGLSETEIAALLSYDNVQLERAIIAELPHLLREKAEASFESGEQWSYLKLYAPRLAQIVAVDWQWPAREAAEEFKDDASVVYSLSQFLTAYSDELPFEPSKLAVALVRVGLSNVCRGVA